VLKGGGHSVHDGNLRTKIEIINMHSPETDLSQEYKGLADHFYRHPTI
jgi:hypothetical protein